MSTGYPRRRRQHGKRRLPQRPPLPKRPHSFLSAPLNRPHAVRIAPPADRHTLSHVIVGWVANAPSGNGEARRRLVLDRRSGYSSLLDPRKPSTNRARPSSAQLRTYPCEVTLPAGTERSQTWDSRRNRNEGDAPLVGAAPRAWSGSKRGKCSLAKSTRRTTSSI
jgi:hypothetical protein